MEYKFAKYNPENLESLTTLLALAFNIKNTDKKGLLEWKYFDSYLKNRTITYVALDSAKTAVGHYTTIPFTILYGKSQLKATLSTDAATHPEHRGKGLMSQLSERMYADVRKKGYDFSFGYPNEVGVMMDRHSKSYGYQLVGKYVRYTKIVFISKRTPLILRVVTKSSEVKNISIATPGYFMLNKDREYIIWRYLKKPNKDYVLYEIVDDNVPVGYVSVRLGEKKCSVLDIITSYSDISHMKNVLRSIENMVLENGIRIVIYNVMDNMYWRGLFGFTYLRKVKPVHYYFSIHLHSSKNKQLILNPEKWISLSGEIL